MSDTTYDAEERFAELLGRSEDGEGVDLDQLIEAEPARLRPRLRMLAEEHRRAEAHLDHAYADAVLGEAEPTGALFFRHHRHEPLQPEPGLAPGKVIGDFKLVSLIGQGGMGQVWEAQQLSLGGRRVALKFVRPERISERSLEFFHREARAAGRLNHAGIVAVHGHGESEGLAWIAMEFVEGAWSLADFISEMASREQVPDGYDRRVAEFVAELADALHAAHEAGVTHRDVKPGNVLVTPQEKPKLTDFGLARITDESALSRSGEFAGSYFYMSPEQVAARRMGIDHRTDLFSLGAILYEMLALQKPFQGDTLHQVTEQILTKDPPDLRTLRSRIPRELALIAGKALEKDRDRRYPSMAELAADLRRFLRNEPILAKPATRWTQAAKWARRNPTKTATGAIALLALAVIAGLLLDNVQRKLALAQQGLALARLSHLQDLQDLIAAADDPAEMWPPSPERIPAYRAWIKNARRLVDVLPTHKATREALRARALARTEEERLQERESHPHFYELVSLSEEIRRKRRALANIGLSLDADALNSRLEEIARLEAECATLDSEVNERRHWRFPAEQEGGSWWNDQLTKLIEGLESLVDDRAGLLGEHAVSVEHGWSVGKRLAIACQLETLAPRWEVDLSAIRECYGDPDLSPVPGLVPIGQDPASKLWEFWHVASGEEPEREPDGELEVQPESGLVLVLLRAGSFWMGLQSTDPTAKYYNSQAWDHTQSPVHEVELSEFFIGKHEMTRAQWARLVGGENPTSEDGLQSIASVSWSECTQALLHFGLLLPTEAQWEYGCRAGSETLYWSGDTDDDVSRVGWYVENSGFPHTLLPGSSMPIGQKPANAWGLHDVHGNLWEWCQDWFGQYPNSRVKNPGGPETGSVRICRGGSLAEGPRGCSSGWRSWSGPDDRGLVRGFRVAALVTHLSD